MADGFVDFCPQRSYRVDTKLGRVLDALDIATSRLGFLEERVSLHRDASSLLREGFLCLEQWLEAMDKRLAEMEKHLNTEHPILIIYIIGG